MTHKFLRVHGCLFAGIVNQKQIENYIQFKKKSNEVRPKKVVQLICAIRVNLDCCWTTYNIEQFGVLFAAANRQQKQ